MYTLYSVQCIHYTLYTIEELATELYSYKQSIPRDKQINKSDSIKSVSRLVSPL